MMLKALSIGLLFLSTFNIASSDTFPEKYHTYNEAIAELSILQNQNSGICQLDSIGYSNRDSIVIYAFKISNNVQVEEDQPAIFLMAGTHADEILGVEIVLRFANDILNKYNLGDTTITRYVNSYEIFIIPFVNPEGHIVVENGDLDWRKNKTDNNHNGIFDFHDGVDLNRNYDFGWDLDTTQTALTPESLMYKGPYPFSESECRAIRDLGAKYKPVIAVEYHSPTYGVSEVAYYCWYWNQLGRFSPDESTMRNICLGFAGSIIRDNGNSTYSAGVGLVNKGDFKTYFYGNFGTAAMTIEVSDTTIQDTSLVDGICQRNLPGIYWLLNRAGYARLTGIALDSITGNPIEVEVRVLEAAAPEIHPRFTLANSGRFDRLINPGTYTLQFIKEGYAVKTIAGVVVNNSGITQVNTSLIPAPAPPILLLPYDNTVFGDSLALDYAWAFSPGSISYVFELSKDPAFAVPLESDTILNGTICRNNTPLSWGRYYWRITALGQYSPSSPSLKRSFYVNLTPAKPIIIFPKYGQYIDTLSSLKWFGSSDPDSFDTIYYDIQVDDDSLFGSPEINVIHIKSDSIFTVTAFKIIGNLPWRESLIPETHYYWRVKGVDRFGASSTWNDDIGSFVFQHQNRSPYPPVSDFYPANSIEVASLTPTITWEPAIDPDADDSLATLHYIIHLISDSSTGCGYEFWDTTAPGVNEVTMTDTLPDNCLWIYQIKTVDDGGLMSGWSTPQHFWTNHYNYPPEPFPLISPQPATRRVDYYTYFKWHNTIDNDPGSSFTFALQYSPDSLFRGYGQTIYGLSDTAIAIPTDSIAQYGNRIYWRVLAIDDDSLIRVGGIPEQFRKIIIVPVGDANGDSLVRGSDVTYLVSYFKGINPAPEPLLSGDVNGDCELRGSDVTYLVRYFKGVGPDPVRAACEQPPVILLTKPKTE